jgi:hypothetical protein
MGLSYHFTLSAPATENAEDLEAFLRTIERYAQSLGFGPTMVLNARFDTMARREFARRLTKGHIIEDERLEGLVLREPQIWDHDSVGGTCRVIPQRGVVLVVTDEQGCETVFGFFQYPQSLEDSHCREVMTTGLGDKWIFQDFVDSPDPRFRQLVRRFAEAGYVDAENDEFGSSLKG